MWICNIPGSDSVGDDAIYSRMSQIEFPSVGSDKSLAKKDSFQELANLYHNSLSSQHTSVGNSTPTSFSAESPKRSRSLIPGRGFLRRKSSDGSNTSENKVDTKLKKHSSSSSGPSTLTKVALAPAVLVAGPMVLAARAFSNRNSNNTPSPRKPIKTNQDFGMLPWNDNPINANNKSGNNAFGYQPDLGFLQEVQNGDSDSSQDEFFHDYDKYIDGYSAHSYIRTDSEITQNLDANYMAALDSQTSNNPILSSSSSNPTSTNANKNTTTNTNASNTATKTATNTTSISMNTLPVKQEPPKDQGKDDVQVVQFDSSRFFKRGGESDVFHIIVSKEYLYKPKEDVHYAAKVLKPGTSVSSMELELKGALLHAKCPDSLLKAYAWDLNAPDSKWNIHNKELVGKVREKLKSSPQAKEYVFDNRDYESVETLPIVLFPYYEAGPLGQIFKNRLEDSTRSPNTPLFSIDEVGIIFCDLVKALDEFWKNNETHNDLKLANILVEVDETKRITKGILADSGSAKIHTVGWVNPQYENHLHNVLFQNASKKQKSVRDDVFPLAVILGSLFSTRRLLSMEASQNNGNDKYIASRPYCHFYTRDWRPGIYDSYRTLDQIENDVILARDGFLESSVVRKAQGECKERVDAVATILTKLTKIYTEADKKYKDCRDMVQLWQDQNYPEIINSPSAFADAMPDLEITPQETDFIKRTNFALDVFQDRLYAAKHQKAGKVRFRTSSSPRRGTSIGQTSILKQPLDLIAEGDDDIGEDSSDDSVNENVHKIDKDFYKVTLSAKNYLVRVFSKGVDEDTFERFLFGARLKGRCPLSLMQAQAWENDRNYHNKNTLIEDIRGVLRVTKAPIIIFPYFEGPTLAKIRNSRTSLVRFSVEEIGVVFTDIFYALEVMWKHQRTHNAVNFGSIFVTTDKNDVIHKAILGNPSGEKSIVDIASFGAVLNKMFITTTTTTNATTINDDDSGITDVNDTCKQIYYSAAFRRANGEAIESVSALANILLLLQSGSVDVAQIRILADHWKEGSYHKIDVVNFDQTWTLDAFQTSQMLSNILMERQRERVIAAPSLASLLKQGKNELIIGDGKNSSNEVLIPGHMFGKERLIPISLLAIWAEHVPDVFIQNVGNLDIQQLSIQRKNHPFVKYERKEQNLPRVPKSQKFQAVVDSRRGSQDITDVQNFKVRVNGKDFNAAVHILSRVLTNSPGDAEEMMQYLVQEDDQEVKHASWENMIDTNGEFITAKLPIDHRKTDGKVEIQFLLPGKIKETYEEKVEDLFFLPVTQKAVVSANHDRYGGRVVEIRGWHRGNYVVLVDGQEENIPPQFVILKGCTVRVSTGVHRDKQGTVMSIPWSVAGPLQIRIIDEDNDNNLAPDELIPALPSEVVKDSPYLYPLGAAPPIIRMNQQKPINRKDEFGRGLLHYAAIACLESVVQLLLAKGALPDLPDGENRTPLQYAAMSSKVIVEMLLTAGASPNTPIKPKVHVENNLVSITNMSAESYAVWYNRKDIFEILQKAAYSTESNDVLNDIDEYIEKDWQFVHTYLHELAPAENDEDLAQLYGDVAQ